MKNNASKQFIIFLIFMLAGLSFLNGQIVRKYGLQSENETDYLYTQIPNSIFFYITPSFKLFSDTFELKISGKSILERITLDQFCITPLEVDYFLDVYFINKNISFDTLSFLVRPPPKPTLNLAPSSRQFGKSDVDSIVCFLDFNIRTRYFLRTVSFDFFIKDSSNNILFNSKIIGARFPKTIKNNIRNIISCLKQSFTLDFMNVIVTDDKNYEAKFNSDIKYSFF